MATVFKSVENLLDAVKQLSLDELTQFTLQLADWQKSDEVSESLLVRQTELDLPPDEATRFRGLATKSEQQELTQSELAEYQRLAQRAEHVDATRVAALAELARRRKQPVSQIKKNIGWREKRHGT